MVMTTRFGVQAPTSTLPNTCFYSYRESGGDERTSQTSGRHVMIGLLCRGAAQREQTLAFSSIDYQLILSFSSMEGFSVIELVALS